MYTNFNSVVSLKKELRRRSSYIHTVIVRINPDGYLLQI